jgi:hypothetical protein
MSHEIDTDIKINISEDLIIAFYGEHAITEYRLLRFKLLFSKVLFLGC